MTTSRVPPVAGRRGQKCCCRRSGRARLHGLRAQSIFRKPLNHPATPARNFNDLLATMLRKARTDPGPHGCELVIMRIGWLTDCDYEWTQHWRG